MFLDEDMLDGIDDYINGFSKVLRYRGINIYEEGAVSSIYYNSEKSLFTATVIGSKTYSIRLFWDPDLAEITKSSCNCPYKNSCKHMAAVSYGLLVEEEAVLDEEASGKPAKNLKIIADDKEQTHAITIDRSSNLQAQLKTIRPRHCKPFQDYSSEIKHFLVGEQTFKSMYYLKDWSSSSLQLVHEVTFIFDGDTIIMKCNSCSFSKTEICCGAYNLLSYIVPLVKSYKQNSLSYRLYVEQIANDEMISEEAVAQLFEVEIADHGVSAYLKSNDVVDTSQITKLKEASSNSQKKMDDDFLLTLSQNKELGEALVWSSMNALILGELLFLVSGKLSAAKDKLATHITKMDASLYMSSEYTRIYNNLSTSLNYGRDDIANYIENTSKRNAGFKLLIDNLDFLKNSLNYYFNPLGNFQYYNYKIKKKDLRQFSFSDGRFSIEIVALVRDGLYTLETHYYINNEKIDITSVVEVNWCFILTGKMVAYLHEDSSVFDLFCFMEGKSIYQFLPKNKDEFFDILLELEKSYHVKRDESLGIKESILKSLTKTIRLSEVGDHVVFHPELKKGRSRYSIYKTNSTLKKDAIIKPDPQEIEAFLDLFNSLHTKFEKGNDSLSFRHLHRNEFIKNEWHLLFFETCKKNKIQIEGYDAFEKIKFSSHKAVIESDISSSIDWFELNITMSFGTEKVTRKEWIKAIKNGQSYIELKDGTLGIIPEEWLVKMTKIIALSEDTKKGLRINKLRFNVIDELFDKIKDKGVIDDIKEKRTLLQEYNTNQRLELPESVSAILRPYQEEGYQWMRFLESCKFGGILADDMGLGKTLQVISLLAQAHQQNNCEALVVVPKSLIFNWARELDKFCPNLKYHIHHGLDRHVLLKEKGEVQIIISTYGIVTRDIETFRTNKFTHIILDESQAIKNPSSKRNKAIRLLKGTTKLCMTGTPIQNNTFDLYAQISFSNPGLLGNQTYFRKTFANPIDKEGDHDASKLLLKMIHPFILRRTKEQVAKDLPEKTESIIYCDMLPHQRIMYTELKNQIRHDLLSLDDKDSQLKFKVLDGLLRLRQLCNSPLLVDKSLKGPEAKSIKIESLIYSLTEEIGSGNALVFSQFVQMLTLIRKELDSLGIPYAYLDGSTQDREAVVTRYMTDDKCKIFLISLKAGNTGLNLTKAQYVYIVDPWWNPAVEAQAIDRTHRIGQKQKVFAYKMICKDSIEEKIILLQKRKKKVAVELIQTDESIFKALNKKDLLELFD